MIFDNILTFIQQLAPSVELPVQQMFALGLTLAACWFPIWLVLRLYR